MDDKKATVQRYSVWKNEVKISFIEFSRSSKHLRFILFQIHQKMQIGTIFQTVALLGLPDFHQQANKSITLLGITQDIPNRVKTWIHRVEVTSQWRRMWSTVSPALYTSSLYPQWWYSSSWDYLPLLIILSLTISIRAIVSFHSCWYECLGLMRLVDSGKRVCLCSWSTCDTLGLWRDLHLRGSWVNVEETHKWG